MTFGQARPPLSVANNGSMRFPKPQTKSVTRVPCGIKVALAVSWAACIVIGFFVGTTASRPASPLLQSHKMLIDGAKAAIDATYLKAAAASENDTTLSPPCPSSPPLIPSSALPPPPQPLANATHGAAECDCPENLRARPYRWAFHYPVDPHLAAARDVLPRPTDEDLERTAIVTMATGDKAARGATTLMQSLIDSGTRVPTLLVLLFRGGHGSKWCDDYPRKVARRGDMYWPCSRPDAVAEEIVSPQYLLNWERMGVQYQIMDPIPDTNWTHIPGGRATWWGMAFNKLRVFHLVQYKKILWLDGDTIVFHNIDHLLLQPSFTAAFMQECDMADSYGKTAGSTWVVEPDWEVFHYLEKVFAAPVPNTNPPVGWHFGDMQVVFFAFGRPNEKYISGTNLPWTYDESQALMPGLRAFLPEFRAMSDGQWKAFVYSRAPEYLTARLASLNGTLPPEGLWPEYNRPPVKSKPIWRMLDVRYEAIAPTCVGYGAGRDLGPDWFNVHFTCMKDMHKPADYASEHELLTDAMTKVPVCLRYYVLRWYEIFVRGMGARLPPPYYNGTLELPRELHLS